METKTVTTVPFFFKGAEVRTVVLLGVIWFVLGDVCRVLGLGNTTAVANTLDDDEKGLSTINTLGGPQEVIIINESGLYSQVLRSRKPAAKVFRRWVTGEVLPAIRKTGFYAAPGFELTADHLKAIGGVVMGITSEQNAEALARIEAQNILIIQMEARATEREARQTAALGKVDAKVERALNGYDETRKVVRGYFTMLEIVKKQGVTDSRGRHPLVVRCSSLLRKWCNMNKLEEGAIWSDEIQKWIFRTDAVDQWLAREGYPIIHAHKDKIAGQGILHLVPKSKRQHQPATNAPD